MKMRAELENVHGQLNFIKRFNNYKYLPEYYYIISFRFKKAFLKKI